MNFLIVMWGIFIGVIITGVSYDVYVYRMKKSIDKRVSTLFTEFQLDFVKNMANADKYIVGGVVMHGGSEISDSMIVCADVDTAITVSGNYSQLTGVNVQNFRTGIKVIS